MRIEDVNQLILEARGVPGELVGGLDPEIVVIGEAPGRDEMKQGRPFVGKAGKWLRRTFDETNIHAYYLTNAAKRQPPYKDRKQTPPSIEALAHWRTYLRLELKAVRPRVIIALGLHAAKAVIVTHGSVAMKDIVNRWYTGDEVRPELNLRPHGGADAPSTRVLVLYHPSYILRNEDKPWHAKLVRDFKRELEKLGGAKPPHWPVVEDSGALLRTDPGQRTVIDVETVKQPVWNRKAGALVPVKGDPDPRVDRMVGMTVLPLTSEIAHTYTNIGYGDALPELTDLVCHNCPFDLTALARRMPADWLRRVNVHDTMSLGYTLGLPDLSLKGIGSSMGVTTVTYANRAEIGDEQYNGQDVWLTKMALNRLLPDAPVAYEIDRHLIPALVEMQARGYYVDMERLSVAIEHYEAVRDRMERMFWQRYHIEMHPETPGLLDPDGSSEFDVPERDLKLGNPNHLAALWGLPDSRKETLKVEIAKGHPHGFEMGVVLQWRQARVRLNTYLYKLRASGRLTGMFSLSTPEAPEEDEKGAATGRVSASDGLQNQPPITQRALMAPDGMLLRRGDFSQIELMVAAQVSGDKYLIAVLNDPTRDLHRETRDHLRLCGPTPCRDNHCPHRTKAKNFNFGAGLYGGQAPYISSVVGCTLNEAEDLMANHKTLWRGWWGYAADHWAEVRRTGYSVEPLSGHRRYIPLLNENSAYRQAINHPPQGGAAYITKAAMYELARDGALLNNQVHDAIHDWVPEDGDPVLQKERMRATMVETARRFLPDLDVRVEVDLSKHWVNCEKEPEECR